MAITSSILAGIGAAIASAASAASTAAVGIGSSIAGLVGGSAAGATAAGATAAGATAAGAAGAAGAGAAGAATTTGAATSAGAAAGTATAAGTTGATTAATTTGGVTAAGMGKGALVGAASGGAINSGTTAIQGGSVGDIVKSGAEGAATGAVTGAVSAGAGSLLKTAGAKVAGAVSKGAGKVTSALGKGAGKVAGQEVVGTLPNIGAPAEKVVTATTGTSSKIAAQGSARVAGSSGGGAATGGEAPVLRPKANISLLDKVNTNLNSFGQDHPLAAKVGTGAKKVAGKVGVQGALQGGLALVSGIQSASQANAANNIQTQSLLFQKQTYNEAKAKEESTKAQLKSDAWNAYSSASLFGENLYGSDSNNTLLTSYNTNGTGNQGVFSLLNTGVTTRKTEDIT